MDSVIESTSDLLPYIEKMLPHLRLLGSALGIEDYAAAVVEGPGNLETKCIDILRKWLHRNPEPTWRVFCDKLSKNQNFNSLRYIICADKV
jgi:hypothetical protein